MRLNFFSRSGAAPDEPGQAGSASSLGAQPGGPHPQGGSGSDQGEDVILTIDSEVVTNPP